MKFIMDAIRSLFWGIAKLFLVMSDWMYEALESIVSLDLSSSKALLYTWMFFLLFIGFTTFLRVTVVIFKKTSDPESTYDITTIPRRIINIFLAVVLSTTVFFFALGVPSQITSIYNNAITYDEKMSPSTSVISATSKSPLSSKLSDMKSTDEVVSIETIEEKLNDEEDGKYIYFVGIAELLLCIAGGFVVMCLQLNIVTDTGTRLFLNMYRFVIGFIPISSLIEAENTFGEWCRDIASDTLTIGFNLIATQFCFGIMATTKITELNGIIRIIIFGVGLLAICKCGDFVARYLRASNLSHGGGLGTMLLGAGVMGATRGLSKAISQSSKYVGGKGRDIFGNLRNNLGYSTGGGFGNPIGDVSSPKPTGGSGGRFGGFPSQSGSGSPASASTTVPKFDPKTGEVYNSPQSSQSYFASGSSGGVVAQGSVYQGGESIIDINPMSNHEIYSSGRGGTGYATVVRSGVGQMIFGGKNSHQKSVLGARTEDKKAMHSREQSKEREKANPTKKINRHQESYSKSRGGTTFVQNKTRGHLYRGSEMKYKQSARDIYRNKQNRSFERGEA